MNHFQHAISDLTGIGNGLVIFAVASANGMQLLQWVGILVAIVGCAGGVSRELREWSKYKNG